MSILINLLVLISILGATQQVQAGVVFWFTESGGNVLMQTSGVLDTSKLVGLTPSGNSAWGGIGIQEIGDGTDIMGDTSMGAVDTHFGFNTGTDVSAWLGNMFTQSHFNWASTGTFQFATYYRDPDITPGLGISAADLVGDLWTPDVSWSKAGSFASFGMTLGDYTITDSLTSEFITIQIGGASPVPVPAAGWLFMSALLGLAGKKRLSRR